MIAAKTCTTHAGECCGQQDVGHGIVATGRGTLQFRSFNRYACWGSSIRFSRGTLNFLP
ncbi:hypothetical protein [Rummeliibacillus sp. SL167]|uniref:hypothetical protein n=1 Tax=Rummeliibacillus sp. SL167 TaxID=2579792 RepID=UPI0016461AEF|nr:hypothetical protein [Rummeliibacillus sp. SL167]